jgi:hypothetical protein
MIQHDFRSKTFDNAAAPSKILFTAERPMLRAITNRFHVLRPRLLRSRPQILQLIRLQHGGPHKEYFQNPGQMPLPETNTHSGQHAPPPEFPREPSLLRRTWNTTGLILWSVLFGFGAGSSLITWAYLQGPFEEGTEEENDMLEEINDMMNEYPAMDGLLNDPEWEEWPVAPRMVAGDSGKGLNFVTGMLTGSKGIVQVWLPLSYTLCFLTRMCDRGYSSTAIWAF